MVYCHPLIAKIVILGLRGQWSTIKLVVMTAEAEVGMAFPLKTHSILLEAPEPLFL